MKKIENIKALILDMDGVLWRGNEPIDNLPEIFAIIAQKGLKLTLATNNSTRTIAQHNEKIARFGVSLPNEQVTSCSLAIAALMKEKHPKGGEVYIVGHEGIVEALSEAGFRIFRDEERPEKPVAVVAGLDREINYEKIAAAATFIRKGAIFYGTNPDKTFPSPSGLMPGAGTILAAIEAASGSAPIIAGKPEPYLLQLAMRRMKTAPTETLMIGDRLETDVLGGLRAGCRTALVLSGVTQPEELAESEIQPDLVAENLRAVLGLI